MLRRQTVSRPVYQTLVGAFDALTNAGATFLEFQYQCLGVARNHIVAHLDLIEISDFVAGNHLDFLAVGALKNNTTRCLVDPEQLKLIKKGVQIEGVYAEAVAISVVAAPANEKK